MTIDVIKNLRAIYEAAPKAPWRPGRGRAPLGNASGELIYVDRIDSVSAQTLDTIVTEHNTYAALLDVAEGAEMLNAHILGGLESRLHQPNDSCVSSLRDALAYLDEVAP